MVGWPAWIHPPNSPKPIAWYRYRAISYRNFSALSVGSLMWDQFYQLSSWWVIPFSSLLDGSSGTDKCEMGFSLHKTDHSGLWFIPFRFCASLLRHKWISHPFSLQSWKLSFVKLAGSLRKHELQTEAVLKFSFI